LYFVLINDIFVNFGFISYILHKKNGKTTLLK
jgi:hypothetical protein